MNSFQVFLRQMNEIFFESPQTLQIMQTSAVLCI